MSFIRNYVYLLSMLYYVEFIFVCSLILNLTWLAPITVVKGNWSTFCDSIPPTSVCR